MPKGVGYYVEADLAERSARFRELASRLEEELPQDDPIRANAATVREHLAAWQQATDAVADARDALARGRTRRDKATRAFVDAVTAVYAALLVRVGKKKVDRFFPAARGGRATPVPAIAAAPAFPAGIEDGHDADTVTDEDTDTDIDGAAADDDAAIDLG